MMVFTDCLIGYILRTEVAAFLGLLLRENF